MDFDKKTIFAFVLIAFILILANTGFYQKMVDPQGYELRKQRKQQALLNQQTQQNSVNTPAAEEQVQPLQRDSSFDEPTRQDAPEDEYSSEAVTFQSNAPAKTIRIESDKYVATLSTKGANIIQWELNKFKGAEEEHVTMLPENSTGTPNVQFFTRENDSLNTASWVFEVKAPENIVLSQLDSVTIPFVFNMGDGRRIVKSYTFFGNKYAVNLTVNLENLSDVIDEKRYFLAATTGLASTEKRLVDDMQYTKAGISASGDVDKGYKANDEWYKETADVDWVGVRTKYFAYYIVPENINANYAEIHGEEIALEPDAKHKWKKYQVRMGVPYLGQQKTNDQYMLYLGPLEYDTLKKYDKNLEKFMDFGWKIIQPFSLAILWSFKKLHTVIPNYGLVIIIFAILIKILVYPLTHKSYESMKKMQNLQPKLAELKEKHKDDPQKLNQATMKMYKEEGVNPMGGCLPMLLQMPLLYGLFIVFRSTIELRNEGFVWWIKDLSSPDTIATLPFSIPLYGDSVNILPLFMGVTMLIQQKMTVTDPKQKAMVYMMPIFLTLLFNSFPSGLNLYYALFNLLTIVQQKYFGPQSKTPAVETVQKRKR